MELEFTKTDEYLLIDETIIVDASYIIEENKWKTIEELIFKPKILQSAILHVDGVEFFIFKTWEGDGIYTVKKHNKIIDEISIDSGYVAIFKKSEFIKFSTEHNVTLEVDFAEKVLVEIEDGKAVGPLKIFMENEEEIEEDRYNDEDNWMED